MSNFYHTISRGKTSLMHRVITNALECNIGLRRALGEPPNVLIFPERANIGEYKEFADIHSQG